MPENDVDLARYGILDIPMADKAGIAFLDEMVKVRDERIARLEALLTLAVDTVEWTWGFVPDEQGARETWERGTAPVLTELRAALRSATLPSDRGRTAYPADYLAALSEEEG